MDAGQQAALYWPLQLHTLIGRGSSAVEAVQQAQHALLPTGISPEQKLPIEVGDINGVHVNYIDVAKA